MIERGKFIVLGGIDGCGKTTQAKRVASEIQNYGYEVLVTREHTRNGAIGQVIEEIVNNQGKKLTPLALQVAFISDRINHAETEIEPAIEEGKIVISDRYYESTPVYAPPEYREILLKFNETLVVKPDLTVIIDVDEKEAVKRLDNNRNKRTIFEEIDNLKKCREAYDWFINRCDDDEKFIKINGTGSEEEVTKRIMNEIEKRNII